MFKSRSSLQTPLLIKLLLSGAIAIFFTGWSISSDASIQEPVNSTIILATRPESVDLNKIARLTHQEVNKYRASLNLAPLKFNDLISDRAKIHSQNMAQGKVEFSHDGFQNRVAALQNTIDYRSAAENVAYNMGHKDPVATAVKGWIKSDGHRKNMEGNYNLTGIGVAINPQGEYYFTQIFILEN